MTTQQKIIIAGSSVVALVLIIGAYVLYSSISEENAYKDLSSSADLAAYEKFIEKYPNSKHYYEVHEKYLVLKEEYCDWEEIKSSTNAPDLERFISVHGDSKFATIAKERLDSVLWAMASKAGTLDGYVDYLSRVPEGKHIAEARDLAANMKKHLLSESETSSASSVVTRFLNAIDTRDQEQLLSNVDSSITFFGRKTGKAYVLSWLDAIYSEDVYGLSVTVNNTQVDKKVGDDDTITYSVGFETDMYYSRSYASEKPTYYNRVGTAILNKDFKIISFTWKNISSK